MPILYKRIYIHMLISFLLHIYLRHSLDKFIKILLGQVPIAMAELSQTRVCGQ